MEAYKDFHSSGHTRKALLAAIAIELLIIFSLFLWHFPSPPKEEKLEINFIPDDFDFSQLQKPKKIEIPDISQYLNNRHLTTTASNDWQEESAETDEFGENNQAEGEQTDQTPEPTPEPDLRPALEKEQPHTSLEKETEERKNFTGESRIHYFVRGRYKVYLKNPIFTCPDYMHGWVKVYVEVDRNGRVVKAEYDKDGSTTDLQCLIDAALRYARATRFNKDPQAPEISTGYIRYMF